MVSTLGSPSTLPVECPPLGTGLDGLPLPDPAAVEECCNWLKFNRLWGQLPDLALQDIARSLHLLEVEPRTFIYQTNQPAIGLYLLKWGAVEIYRLSSRSTNVAAFLQGVTLLSASIFSVYPLLRITKRPLLSNLPHLLLIAGLTVTSFWLII
ncbi:MAG: hypothetical protein MUE44_28180 [Oscillatoriaceae cyanobacterium Prado104]|jgi:hypothetical protein|nr:hypothetical protein [Oscillatoriaceae cyanobacterium Prado104]